MLKHKVDLSAILLIALMWLSGSLGYFSDLEVQNATKITVLKYIVISESQFLKIVIPSDPELNGFAVSTEGLKHNLEANTGTEESSQNPKTIKFYVLIAMDRQFEYYELHRVEKEFLVLFSKQEPVNSHNLQLKVKNWLHEINVTAVAVKGKFNIRKEEYFAVLVERIALAKFEGKNRIKIKSIDEGIDYNLCNFDLTEPANVLPHGVSFTLLVQKSSKKLDSIPVEITEE